MGLSLLITRIKKFLSFSDSPVADFLSCVKRGVQGTSFKVGEWETIKLKRRCLPTQRPQPTRRFHNKLHPILFPVFSFFVSLLHVFTSRRTREKTSRNGGHATNLPPRHREGNVKRVIQRSVIGDGRGGVLKTGREKGETECQR